MSYEDINPIPPGFHKRDAIFLVFLFMVAAVALTWARS